MSNMTEWQLLESYLRGDPKAFEELVNMYKNGVYSFVMKRVGNRAVCDEIFQDTFFRLVRKAPLLEPRGSLKGWVFRTANNLCIDHFRKRGRETVLDDPDMMDTRFRAARSSMPDSGLMNTEIAQSIEKAVDCLSDEQKEVFFLREYSGLSFREISDITESPLNTVLGRMHSALKKMRLELREYHGQ